MTKLVSSVLIVLLGTASVQAQALQRIYIFQWGEYEIDARIRNPEVSRQGIERSLDPWIWKHIRTTRAIVARIGTEFCFRYWPTGAWGATARVLSVTSFPSPGVIGRRSGNRILREERIDAVVIGTPSMWCWSFDRPDDIAPGEWRIELWSGREKLAEQTFTVALPAQTRRR